MDTHTTTLAEVIGRIIGLVTVAAFVCLTSSLILLVAWNRCVPQVFGGQEITLAQSLSMLAVAWTLSIAARIRTG